jgi:hypothetical protein
MRRIKNPKFGEIVLLTHWGDADPHDSWVIGPLEAIMENNNERYYRIKDNERWFGYCFRISEDEIQTRVTEW